MDYLSKIEFFKDPNYLNKNIDKLFKDINNLDKLFGVTPHVMDNSNNHMTSIPFEYFTIFNITLNDLLKYGRLINKEIALMAKWLFDNNDTITLQAFIFNYYYMGSVLKDGYDYKSMVEELDKFKKIDNNKKLFRHKFKNDNWFVSHSNNLFNSKPDELIAINDEYLTKKHDLKKESRHVSQSGGNKKTKRVKRIHKN